MKQKQFLKILLGIVTFLLLIILSTTIFIEPWLEGKIQVALNESSKDYRIEVGKVHVSLISSGVELDSITISTKHEVGNGEVNGEILSIKFNGINLAKVLFKKGIDIREVIISKSRIMAKIPFSVKGRPPIVSPLNIRIRRIIFDQMDLSIGNTSNALAYSVKEGVLKVYDLQVGKQDTLSRGIVKQFDFKAKELLSVSSDSMYTYKVAGITYNASSSILAVRSFIVDPNYSYYEFSARHQFSIDRFKGSLKNVYIRGFSAVKYLKSNNLRSSDIEIGELDFHIFRDFRKKVRHINQPAFQDLIYKYPGNICLDSIRVINGDITYIEHARAANKPGSISFNDIHATIYKITNDTIYKTKNAFMELKGKALLMGKGKLTLLLKAKLFDRRNTFSLKGSLSGMEANELNPMLSNNAFVYVKTGKINSMNFSLTANSTKATGNITLLYNDLKIAVLNKRTDKSTALKERLISFIANIKVLNSNPLPGEDVRVGTIDYERNPEKFLFNYVVKSLLSGLKTSLVRSPIKKKV